MSPVGAMGLFGWRRKRKQRLLLPDQSNWISERPPLGGLSFALKDRAVRLG